MPRCDAGHEGRRRGDVLRLLPAGGLGFAAFRFLQLGEGHFQGSDPVFQRLLFEPGLSGHRLDGLRHHDVVDLDVVLQAGRSSHRFVAVEHSDDQLAPVPNLERVDR